MRNGVCLNAKLISTLSGKRVQEMERGFRGRMPKSGGIVKEFSRQGRLSYDITNLSERLIASFRIGNAKEYNC